MPGGHLDTGEQLGEPFLGDVIIGMEVVDLSGEHTGPWRMTVDCWDQKTGKIMRYQVTGHYKGHGEERTVKDVSQFQDSDEIGRELNRLDYDFAAKVAPLAGTLFREQVRVVHGQEGIDLLDREHK